MKRSDLIRYISVAVICLLSGSVGQRPNAKSVCEAEDFNILSAFNLKADLIIQVLSKGVYEFWGIGHTDTFTTRESVSQDVRHRYYRSMFLPDPNTSFIFTHVNNVNFDLIDEKQAIYGYVAPLSRKYWVKCLHINWTQETITKLHKDDCDELEVVYKDPNTNFVCIHGSKISKTQGVSNEKGFNVYKYNSSDGMLSHIERYALRLLVLDSCMSPDFYKKIDPKLNSTAVKSVVNWYEYKQGFRYEYFKNITVFKPTNGTLDKLLVLRSRPVTPEIFVTHYNDFVYIFRFNSYYEFMVCGNECNLDAPLQWLYLKEEKHVVEIDYGNGTIGLVEEFQSKLEHRPLLSKITIRKLLGCPEDYTPSPPPQLDPIQFCNQNRKFLSIFSLGNDIYFQSSGRFWRTVNNHFTEMANPELKSGNKYGIQLESDFTQILEKELDTFSAVFGFSFLSNYLPECHHYRDYTLVQDCENSARTSREYYDSCIYGSKNIRWNEMMRVNPVSMALHITPHGISKAYGKQRSDRSLKYMEYFCQDLRAAVIDGQRGLQAVTSPQTSKEKNMLWALYGTLNANDKSKLVQYEWPVRNDDMPVFNNKLLEKKVYDVSDAPQFLFTLQYAPLAFRVDTKGEGKLYDLRDNSFKPKSDNFHSFFNCPFNSDLSLVTVQKEYVCTKRNPLLVESVFLIGYRHYHQIGQHFYVFDKNRKHFLHDIHSSKMFAKYFDTTHRLTGYSYTQLAFGNLNFEVMIHGKANEEYNHLGQYISALFSFSEAIPFLQVMNIRVDSIIDPNVTIGAVSGFEKDGFIDAMAGGVWNPGHLSYLWFWVRELKENKYQVIEDMTRYIFIDDYYKVYTLPKNRNWSVSEIHMKDVPFGQLFGMYIGSDGKMVVLAYDKQQPLIMTEFIDNDYDHTKSTDQILLMNVEDTKTVRVTYSNTYCLKTAKSEAETKASKIWTTIFAVLLLLNMIMALIVAFLTYQKNENKEGIPKSKCKETNSKKADTASND